MIRQNNTGLTEQQLSNIFELLDTAPNNVDPVQLVRESCKLSMTRARKAVGLWLSHKRDELAALEEDE